MCSLAMVFFFHICWKNLINHWTDFSETYLLDIDLQLISGINLIQDDCHS